MSQEDFSVPEEDLENLDEEEIQDEDQRDIMPPNDFKKGLSACLSCYFILAKAQWQSIKDCPNCGENLEYRKPTTKFTGITCITNPGRSWQTTRMKVVKRICKYLNNLRSENVKVPGAYAISLNEENENQQAY